MKIFTYILTAIAIILIGYNVTQIDFDAPFEGQSLVALITIFAGLCAIILLAILRVSKKIEQTIKRKKLMFDVLIIGGGAAGMSCGLILGSAHKRPYVEDKHIGIITHQKGSHLQTALFNNVLGLQPGTTGASILESGKEQLSVLYPHVLQIDTEKVLEIEKISEGFQIKTNKASYTSKIVVVAVGYTNLLTIKGLEQYTKPHPRTESEKNRIWLENTDHLITENLYVAGTLAGWRSQFAIASGSGAHVATDILTLWNNGKHTKVHDKA